MTTELVTKNEWSQFTLSQLCSLITDGKHGDCQDQPHSGFYFLSVKDILSNRLVYENARQIKEKDFSETNRRTNLQPGDILFTNTGTIGRIAIAEDDPRTYRTTFQKSVAILKARRDLIEPDFLYYLLHFDNARLSEFAAGTTQKNLLLKDIRTFEVNVPPLPEQRAIAHILGTLDDKIELNRQINQTLEEMARAIYKDWFVDFGPVRAKLEGRAPYLPLELWDLFPNELVDSELGEIPEGWEVGELRRIATFPVRTVKPQELSSETVYIGLEHMPRKSVALNDWETAEKVTSSKLSFHKGEFLFGKLRPYFHKVGMASTDGICSTDIVVVAPRDTLWSSFVLLCISTEEFVSYTDQTSNGTRMPRTNWKTMGQYKICIPPKPVAREFQNITQNSLNRTAANIGESRLLSRQRDALLPHLLSGEVMDLEWETSHAL